MDRLNNHTVLYRPVGLEEMALIYDSGMKAFPARLPNQPIFYPVLDLEYARQVASDWNLKHGQFAGYVTQFKVDDEYIDKFEKHTVGGSQHQEFWIPAEEVDEFNKHIVGNIKVVEAYFGTGFEGFIPDQFGLQGKSAVEQFTLLTNSYIYKRMDFYLEIKRNHKTVFLNFPFWQTYDFKNPTLKEKILQAIKEAWFTSFPKNPLVINSARADTKLVEEADSVASEEPVEDEVTGIEEIESDGSAESVHEDNTLGSQADSSSFVDRVDEETPPAKKRDSNSPAEPVRENVLKPDSSRLSIQPVDQRTAPVERASSHFLGKSFRKQITPANQTIPDLESPRQPNSHLLQGTQSGLIGKYNEAIEELSKAVEENPNDVLARTSLGVALHRLGEDERALASYEEAIKIDPRYAEAHYFQANILYEQGDVREAIAGYTMAIGLKPELIEADPNLIPQDRLTDYTGAPVEMVWIAKPARRILDLDRAIEKNPGDANLFKERAAQYSRLWNYEQAIADYSAALKLQPDDSKALHSRGIAYEQIGQHDRASEDFQRAIVINPKLADEFLSRGVNFGKVGNFRQSIASLSEGIRLAPKNPNGYFNRGITYFFQGDFENAIEDFSNAIRLAPKDDAAYYWRGIAYEESGRQREAIADYREFLNLSQDPRLMDEIEQRLSQWNEGTQKKGSERTIIQQRDEQRDPREAERSSQRLDVYKLMVALGERAINSTWYGSGLKCYGKNAEELHSSTQNNQPIAGRKLLGILSGIDRTVEGDLLAFDRDADSGWLLIRAWEGSGFYIETNDPESKERLKTRFQSVEEVDSATPSYEGLFIRS